MMSPFSYKATDIAAVTGGALARLGSGTDLTSISTDTRRISKDAVFVALEGERFDGHDFVGDAVAAGANCLIVHSGRTETVGAVNGDHIAVIEVDDTLKALGALAEEELRRWGGKVVGLTGSAGKTTTKELITAALKSAGRVLSTPGNWNNRIGLPLTVFTLDDQDFAVLEMGTNEPGEIAALAHIANPDVGLITNVAPAHLEGFGSVEGVQEEKGALFRQLGEGDTAVVNLDDSRVVEAATQCDARKISYGVHADADIRLVEVSSAGVGLLDITIDVFGERHQVTIEGLGSYMGGNVAAALATAIAMGVDAKDALAGMTAFKAPSRRMVYHSFQGIHVIDDCYNANPKSTEVAIKTMETIGNGERRAVVLGDMLELGPEAESHHKTLGRQAGEAGLSCVFAVGEFASAIVEGVREVSTETEVHVLPDAAAATVAVTSWAKPGDWILVKGSRGVALEQVVEAFEGMETK